MGLFTVRSCYNMSLSARLSFEGISTRANSASQAMKWNTLWEQHIPPKVRVFLWRACHDIILMRSEMVRRHEGAYPYGPFCRDHVETLVHALFACETISFIWSEAPFNLGFDFSVVNLRARLMGLRDRLGKKLFLHCMLETLELRNHFLHDNMSFFSGDVVLSHPFLEFYQVA